MSSSNLKDLAQKALQFSYSPYSKKRIGSSLILTNGKVYSGCNIENASYGGTVCAERVAIWKAYSENTSDNKIKEIYIASEAENPWPPCGMCRQVMAEFATPDTKVTIVNLSGQSKEFKFKDLFPESFGPQNF
ncbi:MAG: cytidine deaminase [Pseudobdellovibrio sp.]